MGAWDYGIFDDDAAYDFTEEIKSDPKEFFKSSFEQALNAEYLEYDECHMATVSAAYIDNYLNGTKYRTDSQDEVDESNVNIFKDLRKGLELDDLRESAVGALEIVISEKSELNELWSENEELYSKWKNNIRELINRLN